MSAKHAALALMVLTILPASFSAHAQEAQPQATAPVPPATGDANASTADPAELNEKARQRMADIYRYSTSLPTEKRQVYTDIMYNMGFVLHKMKHGLVKPDDLDKQLKALDKLYEDDGKLSEKEATKWFSGLQGLAQIKRY